MKKLLAIAILLAGLVSCSDDDNKEDINFDNLQKRWYYVSSIVGGRTTPYVGNETCGKDYLEFQAAGVLRFVDVYDCQADPRVTLGTYTTVDKNITTILNGVTMTYTVIKLNNKDMRIDAVANGTKITYVYTTAP
ncbi:hypothetical protein [Flavobacterium psychrotrophum]|uniref:hypothetical protein n=1 Tax=Flavobacterium psychrotrophum TaxID=2294119 RepID=UPI000E31CC8F|nr:hypothetical protein [Flavobacterium psychrotrophum]